MKDRFFIVVDNFRVQRMTRTAPRLSRNELYVEVNISVPDENFRRPALKVEINAGSTVPPQDVAAEVVSALKGRGIDLKVLPCEGTEK